MYYVVIKSYSLLNRLHNAKLYVVNDELEGMWKEVYFVEFIIFGKCAPSS
jgi:hypothetical protein